MSSERDNIVDLMRANLPKRRRDRDATMFGGGEPPMPPNDAYTRAESDAKLEALEARMDSKLTAMEGRLIQHMDQKIQDLSTGLDAKMERLYEKHLAPIKLDHARLLRDMNWSMTLLVAVFAGVFVILVQFLTSR